MGVPSYGRGGGNYVPSRGRVLHVLGSLDAGGVENWLLEIVRHRSPSDRAFDFCLLGSREGAYAGELRRRGCRICRCPLGPFFSFPARLFALLLRSGYEIVHSHVHPFSGLILAIARAAGIPYRLAHSHNTHDGREDRFRRRLYRRLMQRCLLRWMTLGLGCSEPAAEQILGVSRSEDERIRVLRYGIDLQAFRDRSGEGLELRPEFGLEPDAVVVGHVGRLDPQKNHQFLLHVAAEAVRAHPRLRFVIVGEGRLEDSLRAQAGNLGLRGRVVFAGCRDDVPRLMTGLFSAFVLPSLHEGLPIAALEAQAAGLPTLLSDRITGETAVVSDIVRRLPLEAGALAWAKVLLNTVQEERYSIRRACRVLEERGFSVEQSARKLYESYETALRGIGVSVDSRSARPRHWVAPRRAMARKAGAGSRRFAE